MDEDSVGVDEHVTSTSHPSLSFVHERSRYHSFRSLDDRVTGSADLVIITGLRLFNCSYEGETPSYYLAPVSFRKLHTVSLRFVDSD